MPTLPTDSKLRKEVPLYSGVLRYFPAALAGVARVCAYGNRKHCADAQTLRWDRSRSADEADALVRHLLDMAETDLEPDSQLPLVDFIAWRALALAQKWHEARGKPVAPAAINAEGER